MRIALATSSSLPDWEVDDAPLHRAVAARGAEAVLTPWDDPGVRWATFDACLIRTTWDYMERRDEYVAWAERVAAGIPLFNAPDIVRWNTHKSYLRDLERLGAPVVPTVWLPRGTTVDLPALLAERRWKRAFLKPAIGATARETLRFDHDDEGLAAARSHLDRLLAGEDMLLQPYLPRVETEGEVSAVFVDGRVTHTVRKIPVPGDYRVQDDHGASDEPVAFTPDELDLAERIVRLVDGNLLYARTDFLRDDGGALRLSELELVEPSMFFRHGPHAADALADALIERTRARARH